MIEALAPWGSGSILIGSEIAQYGTLSATPPCFAVLPACHMLYGLHSHATQWLTPYGMRHIRPSSESGNALQPALTCEADHMADNARHSCTRSSTNQPPDRSLAQHRLDSYRTFAAPQVAPLLSVSASLDVHFAALRYLRTTQPIVVVKRLSCQILTNKFKINFPLFIGSD